MDTNETNLQDNVQESSKAKKRKWKKRLGTILLIVFNVVIIAITAINEFADGNNASKFSDVTISWWFLFPAIFLCVFAIAVETIKYALVMKKTCGYFNIRVCLETVIFGRYYDNITPSGVGGQPFQIFHMAKCGVPAAQSAAIPLAGFMSMQYGFIILALICFIFGGWFMESNVMRIAGYFGLVMYSLFPTAILMFTFFPKASIRILNWGVGILAKIHIIKDKEKAISAVETNVREYVTCIRTLMHSKGLMLEILALGILYQAAICSIPFFVITAFGGNLNFFECFCTTISIYATITFIPTPGNMGAAEGSFYAVFNSVSKGYIFWAMLCWRLLTCYIFIAAGLIVYLERAITAKREKRETNET